MTESQDVDALKRRGRRRLIGAIALMLLAVIVLPMVFDAEPRNSAPPVNVRIPDEDGSAFKPRVLPPGATESPRQSAPATPAVPANKDQASTVSKEAAPEVASPAAGATPTPAQAPSPAQTPAPAPVAPAPKSAPVPPPQSAAKIAASEPKAAAAGAFVIPVAALAEAEKVKALTGTLAAAKIPYYTEPLATAKGQVTRVRAGPFSSKEQAEQANARLKALGLKPGNVIQRNG